MMHSGASLVIGYNHVCESIKVCQYVQGKESVYGSLKYTLMDDGVYRVVNYED